MRVAMTSTNLKGTYIKDLRDAATYITAAWKYDASRKAGAAQGSATTRLAEARMMALEEENAALRQELSRRAACAHECPRYTGPVPVPGRAPREDGSRVERPDAHSRIDALEEKVDRLRPSILRAMEQRFGGQAESSESRNTAGLSNTGCATQTPAPSREQRSDEWKVVENKKSKKKRKKEDKRKAAASGEQAKRGPLPPPRTTGVPKTYAAAAATAKKGPMKSSKVATLPRAPRTSAVTLTINEGAKTSYPDVVAAARRTVELHEIGVDAVNMRKAVTGAIVIKVPGDKDKGKASRSATRLAEVLDPTAVKIAAPTRTAELRLVGIDISVNKEELREMLASAIGCGGSQIQVGEIGVSRGGLGSAWVERYAGGTQGWVPRDGRQSVEVPDPVGDVGNVKRLRDHREGDLALSDTLVKQILRPYGSSNVALEDAFMFSCSNP
jgi:hypothetical protein